MQSGRVHVVCVGLATVDIVYRVPHIPCPDEKAEASRAEIAAGGPATNAAITAAALGATVTLVSAVGAHPLTSVITSDLADHQVTLHDAAPHATAPPPVSAVTVHETSGARTIVSRNAAGTHVTAPADLDDVISAADVVLLDGHHPALAVAAARSARLVVLDAGSWRPVFAELLPRADVVACSAAFRHPAARTGDPASTARALYGAGAPHVAITYGPEPVRWWSGERQGKVPVPPVAAVDTAGAGDAFHGALAVALARDPAIADLEGALRYAVAVAGVRVTQAGPRSWLADPRLTQLAAAGDADGQTVGPLGRRAAPPVP